MRLLIFCYVSSVPFTRDVLSRESSLGGSESACLGLMEALAKRGHDCHIFATRLDPQAEGEWRGVNWHPAEMLPATLAFTRPDVFVSLRMTDVFQQVIPAKLTILWAQDLLTDPKIAGALAQVDHIAYVSAFHRKQWEQVQPVVAPLGWVTRNGIDPADLAGVKAVHRLRHRFIYTSRPERGLKPLLKMWPAIRAAIPDAELQVCRYRSMYDGEGEPVAAQCREFDRLTAAVNRKAGGITLLGHLNKPDLYKALASARLLLYPGVPDFAETNGIAWTEAQACGTPIISSWKGAAPETVHRDAGVLLEGDAGSPDYQQRFVAEVVRLAEDDEAWRAMSEAGQAWALPRCSHDTIAAEWDEQIREWFTQRFEARKPAVMRQFLWWDQHAAAQRVAATLPGQEAREAYALCTRVIAQQEQTPEDYAHFAGKHPENEARLSERLRRAAALVAEGQPKDVLDVACGNGAMALLLAQALPESRITAVDSSEGVLMLGLAAANRADLSHRITFGRMAWDQVLGQYDAVFCGEFLEHVERPWTVLDKLESYCVPGGRVVLTCPCGPFSELLQWPTPRKRGHVHAFSLQDLAHMTRDKRDVAIEYLPAGASPRGTAVGYWLLSYTSGGGPAVPLDYTQTILTERPYQRIAASLIVKDGADTLRRCLRSIRPVVDRIVVLDTGSTDGSQAIARAEGAEVVEAPWPGDFASARNQALDLVQHEAEWVLWIDADEELLNGQTLRAYVQADHPFAGYVIRQQHLMADQQTFSDRPIRLFRTGRGVRFYGLVHEQPEDAPDLSITPAIELPDAVILHYGYTTDAVRRQKLLNRNLDLLEQELRSEQPRELAGVLALRDAVNLALFARESAGGVLTPDARAALLHALSRYRRTFADPAHRYHSLARPFYEAALEQLDQGWQVEWSFRAGQRLRGRVPPETFRVLTSDEMRAEIDAKLAQWAREMDGLALDCEPFVTRNGDGGWGESAHQNEDTHAVAR
jgi:glycosyltransferase involved in cell wall biosynthesis/SAM-dependent methyltransferase